jgi:1,4-alpha-glucan branching enzyme
MGNEFGHPEWVDFPRTGNNWSYHFARRQWRLRDDAGLKYHFLADFDQAMIALAKRHGIIGGPTPRLIRIDERDKVLAFERCGLLFLFNFHPSNSLVDYPLEAPPGEYMLELDTDQGRFGGQDRLAQGQQHLSMPRTESGALRHLIQVYLPCRVGMALRRLTEEK